jgi:transcriptional regulator with XRE-family HTH domain
VINITSQSRKYLEEFTLVAGLRVHAPNPAPPLGRRSPRGAVMSGDRRPGRSFGHHIRSLRRARGLTQELLAERSGLAPDTIRRLEHGSFSPSLETLYKACAGLDIKLSTLFEAFELGARNETRELIDLIATRSPRELVLATRVLQTLFTEIDDLIAGIKQDAERAAAEQREQDGREEDS